MRDPTKKLSEDSAQYPDWIKFLSAINEAGHEFNAVSLTFATASQYVSEQFDRTAEAMLLTVHDYRSAVACGKALDKFAPQIEKCLRELTSGNLPRSKRPSSGALMAFRRQLLRRAEHWKAQAHAAYRGLLEESVAQRASRRKRVVNPLLRKAGIRSDEEWAARANTTMDRNTPRDYRSGKTKRLRKSNRVDLAQALKIEESRLPD
jgi:hypothetical protein